ncbi:hypothetical protein [Mycolicibacterium sp. 018/SC-01/001]|nr:hypothetical protein [Mycolicibacterium sp. 018/SC-01/001]
MTAEEVSCTYRGSFGIRSIAIVHEEQAHSVQAPCAIAQLLGI